MARTRASSVRSVSTVSSRNYIPTSHRKNQLPPAEIRNQSKPRKPSRFKSFRLTRLLGAYFNDGAMVVSNSVIPQHLNSKSQRSKTKAKANIKQKSRPRKVRFWKSGKKTPVPPKNRRITLLSRFMKIQPKKAPRRNQLQTGPMIDLPTNSRKRPISSPSSFDSSLYSYATSSCGSSSSRISHSSTESLDFACVGLSQAEETQMISRSQSQKVMQTEKRAPPKPHKQLSRDDRSSELYWALYREIETGMDNELREVAQRMEKAPLTETQDRKGSADFQVARIGRARNHDASAASGGGEDLVAFASRTGQSVQLPMYDGRCASYHPTFSSPPLVDQKSREGSCLFDAQSASNRARTGSKFPANQIFDARSASNKEVESRLRVERRVEVRSQDLDDPSNRRRTIRRVKGSRRLKH